MSQEQERRWTSLTTAAEEISAALDIPIGDAKPLLLDLIERTEVTAGGYQWYEADDAAMGHYFVHIERNRPRGQVEWDGDFAFNLTTVQVEPERLRRRIGELMAKRADTDTLPTPAYTTDYLQLIFQTIRDLEIDHDRQPGNDEIKFYLSDKIIEGEGLSARMKDAIASIVRLPESRRGGPVKARPLRGAASRRRG